MKKLATIALPTLLVLFLLLQLVPVNTENPPVTAAMPSAGAEVDGLLQAACNDCHTHETTWPWYSKIAPVSIFVARHVDEGREHFNLSTWGELPADRRDHKLEEMIEMVEEGEMPLRSYVLMHPEAKLTAAQRDLLVEWARAERARIQAEPGFGEGS